MSYAIAISKSVQKQIDNLPNDVIERVIEKIQNLALEPRPGGIVKLKGSDNEYRIRIGDYRVRYEINDESQLVQILQCKHRKDVYRKSYAMCDLFLKPLSKPLPVAERGFESYSPSLSLKRCANVGKGLGVRFEIKWHTA